MRLLKFGREDTGRYQWAYVECTPDEIRPVLHDPRGEVPIDGSEMCLYTLAKAFYRPEGVLMYDGDVLQSCFYINGYHGDDVTRVLQRLNLVE